MSGATNPWAFPTALAALAIACAAISPIIVARRWAFVGEGVAHGSFGGAGVVWLLAVALPGIGWLRSGPATSAGLAAGSLATALIVGRITRRRGEAIGFDAAVGVILTASLAIGFLARSVFQQRFGTLPARGDAVLFGSSGDIPVPEAILAVAVAASVAGGLALFRREVLAYALDPDLADLSGVRSAWVHHGLLLAAALAVAVGGRLVGTVLVVALLVLPGAIAARSAGRLGTAWAASVASALAAVGVAFAATTFTRLPAGPVVVLALAGMFVASRFWGSRGVHPRVSEARG